MFEHLRAHVVGGAGKGRRKVRCALKDPGDPKVSQLDYIVLQKDVPKMHTINFNLDIIMILLYSIISIPKSCPIPNIFMKS